MNRFLMPLTLFFVIIFGLPATAVKIEFHDFKNKEQEKLYLQLIAELRCVKCQNQNLAESNAELATDMRNKTYQMVVNGGSRDDVITYMTDRYGDFVLYRPPFKTKTLLLWLGPAALLLVGLYFLVRRIRQQPNETPAHVMSDDERRKMRDLLDKK